MPISTYLKTFPWDKNALIAFSSRTTSKTILKKDQFEKIKSGHVNSKNENQLIKLGILTKDPLAEKKQAATLFDRLNAHSTTLTVTIVLNLDCNFACTYCYEGDIKGGQYLSEKTADQIIGFIENRLTSEIKTLMVDFYGGEPLLSPRLIESISQKLVALAQSRGILFSSTMITNGSLLKRPVAKKIADLGLKLVQITLDGPAPVHNRYRPFKSGAGSFDVILDNVKACMDLVHVNIGGNYDETSYPHFVTLLDEFEKQGLTPDRLNIVKFSPISQTPQTGTARAELHGGCLWADAPWLLDAERLLRREILKRGYKTPKVQTAFCAIENKNAHVVNFNGDVYKCPGFIGNPAFVVGHVSEGIGDYSKSHRLDLWKNDECISCTYFPLCYGGCRYMTYFKRGAIDTVDCKKDYFDAQLEILVKQDIEFKENVV